MRREGKADEADAEFELAKTLEKQMEDLDQQMGKTVVQEDMDLVDNLLDPQLMAALKGLGFNDGELHGDANDNILSVGAPSVNKSNQQLNPQAGKGSTNRPSNTSSTNVQPKTTIETSHQHQPREERIPNRTPQPNQPTGGSSSKGEERVGLQREGQRMEPRLEGGKVNRNANSVSQVQRKQLESQIKREKVKAVELKRAGRQGEALDILRGAKRLEKELRAMAS